MGGITKGIYYDLEGVPELEEMFKNILPRETLAIARRTANQQADKVRDKLRIAAPKDTGNLEQAIISRAAKRQTNVAMAVVLIQRGHGAEHDAYYWHFIEFGTVHMEAQPFIVPTVESSRHEIQTAFRTDLERNLASKLAAKAKKVSKA